MAADSWAASDQAAGRSIAVVSSDGDVTLAMAEVTLITPIGTQLLAAARRVDRHRVQLYASSGVAQLNLNSDTVYRRLGVTGTPRRVAHPDEERRRVGSGRPGVRRACRICDIPGRAGSSWRPAGSRPTRAWG